MLLRFAALLFLSGAIAGAQSFYSSVPESADDVISATDGRGNITSVYNLFDGRNHAINVTRLNARGATLWNFTHMDGIYEKAYSAAMDQNANAFIAGIRRLDDRKYFLTLKYAPNGYLAWENQDGQNDCTAVAVIIDADQNVLVAGICRYGQSYPARIVKYHTDGALLWAREFDQGGRNYVRGLSADSKNNVSLTLETIFGNYRDGAYQTRTVVYDENGGQIEVR